MRMVVFDDNIVAIASNNIFSDFESRACRRMSRFKMVSIPASYVTSKSSRCGMDFASIKEPLSHRARCVWRKRR